jgi:antitoxin (DNA-binding transcriptional repressor) of toxin-antitoxin stability system
MSVTGLRNLRRQASRLVRRAAAGETIAVTVNGRTMAELGPVQRNRWRSGADIAQFFRGPTDDAWSADRDRFDASPVDPFAR